MRARVLALGISLSTAFFVVACTGLKHAAETEPTPIDDEEEPTEGDGDAGTRPDGSTKDGGPGAPPPDDFACGTDAWTKPTKTSSDCTPRQVRIVEAEATLYTNGISIARTPAGRVGIVYNSDGDIEGALHVAHFTPKSPSFAAPKVIHLEAPLVHVGYRAKVAAVAPDTLRVLSYDLDDSPRSGDVLLRDLVAGNAQLTEPLVAFEGVAAPTEIGLATDLVGNTYATARVMGSTTAKLSAKRKTPTGSFTFLPDLTDKLLPAMAPGSGATSMFVDAIGQLHLLYHHNETQLSSAPRYHMLAGSSWTSQKTVDNASPNGYCGYSPRIVAFGDRRYAAYFYRRAGQSPPETAELRLATWESSSEIPKIEVLESNISSRDALSPMYAVAMAVDEFGLVHLAVARPATVSEDTGPLEYRRQVRTADGGTKWLMDVVDPDVLSSTSLALVDLVVDESTRPHIAYLSGKDGLVRYATRFDR